MRFIIMILAALGAFWWLKQREETQLEERQDNLPTGVQLIPDKGVEEKKPASPAKVQAAATAETPAPPPEASAAAVKTAKPKPSVPSKPGKAKSDDLTVLNGIGKVFAQRLNEAGINTYADLAAQSPERLREITQAKDWQKVEPSEWIAQAKRLAEGDK